MPDYITNLRYLKKQNIEKERELQANHYRELIQYYGVDVKYFRISNNYFKEDTIDPQTLETTEYNLNSNFVYGEYTQTEYMSAEEMVVYINVNGNNNMINIFGEESDENAELYMTKLDFTNAFRKRAGVLVTEEFTIPVFGTLYNFSGEITGELVDSAKDIRATISQDYVHSGLREAGAISFDFDSTPIHKTTKVLNNTYNAFEYEWEPITGNMTGTLTGVVDYFGKGTISGDITGTISYYVDEPDNGSQFWGIAPMVGDFIRLTDFDDGEGNYNEYEISEVIDQDLTKAGINPMIKKYIWRCTINRRKPSYEDVDDELQEEAFTADKTFHNKMVNKESDEIFNYSDTPIDDIDLEKSDDIYGGY